MKFKYDGIGKHQAKSGFFQENLIGRKMLKWDQDHDLLWKLINQDPIIFSKLSTLIILLKKIKISDNYERSDSNKNESFCSEDNMVSEGSKDEIDENESQQEVLKIEAEGDQRKAKKLLWCRSICSRSNHKRYSWIHAKNN